MNTYAIVARTNKYIASGDPEFNGKTEVILESGLSLRDAREEILRMYNRKYASTRYVGGTWGMAVMISNVFGEGASKTYPDGTRSFTYDSRTYSIEIEQE